MKKSFLESKVLPLIGIALFIGILNSLTDPQEIIEILSRVNIDYFILANFYISISIIMRIYKWRILMDSFSVPRINVKELLYAWLVGNALGAVSPGKVGELWKSVYFKKKLNIPRTGTSLSIIMDRISDILSVLVIGLIGLVVFASNIIPEDLTGIVVGLIGISILGFIFLGQSKLLKTILRPFFHIFIPNNLKSKVKANISKLYTSLKSAKAERLKFAWAFVVSLLAWVLTIYAFDILALALNVELSLIFLLQIMPIALVIEGLPISFSGIGTRDAAFIFFFSLIGLSAGFSVSYSILILLMNYVYVFIGFLVWLSNKR